jgi:hypothetical protein
MSCAAKEYGDCTTWGEKEVEVLFIYRDKYGGNKPDEKVKVCICEAHRNVLNKLHDGQLEMRGEQADEALHDDLFQPFADKENKENTYTVVKIISASEETEDTFHLLNGRDIEKFRKYMSAANPDIRYIAEEAIFLVNHKDYNCESEVIEMKPLTGERELHGLSNLTTYYKPVSEMIRITGPGWLSVESRVEVNPTMATEYTIESSLSCVHKYFTQKLADYLRTNFEECLEFMENIDGGVLDIKKLRETSPHSDEALHQIVRRLTDALCVDDLVLIAEMKKSGEITEEVLWVTYVLANHELFWSHLPGRNLRKNIPLINLFIDTDLHERLLLLAMSGERERWLDKHQRTHHNILHDNVEVVDYLVPSYFKPGSMIIVKAAEDFQDEPVYKYVSVCEYYTNFSTAMYNINPFCGKEEPFEKNPEIHLLLLKSILYCYPELAEADKIKYRLDYDTLSAKIKKQKYY